MPILVSGFFVLQLDRSNISNALTDTIKKDLGLTQSQVNAGASLMQAGIVIAELPANALLQKVGAPVWLTAQVFCFGIISLAQAWCKNSDSFLATRFILGLFEAGYIPGAQYMLSLFYREKELALRTAIFYFGNYFAAATGSLIAAGVLQLGGRMGYAGWQWLFISKLGTIYSGVLPAQMSFIETDNFVSRRLCLAVHLPRPCGLLALEPDLHYTYSQTLGLFHGKREGSYAFTSGR